MVVTIAWVAIVPGRRWFKTRSGASISWLPKNQIESRVIDCYEARRAASSHHVPLPGARAWEPGIGLGKSAATATNVTKLNELLTTCGDPECAVRSCRSMRSCARRGVRPCQVIPSAPRLHAQRGDTEGTFRRGQGCQTAVRTR